MKGRYKKNTNSGKTEYNSAILSILSKIAGQ